MVDRAGFPSKRETTPVIKENLNPIWSERNRFNFGVTAVGPTVLYLTVFDWDLGLTDDFLGEASFDLTKIIKDAHDTGMAAEELTEIPLGPMTILKESTQALLEENPLMSRFEPLISPAAKMLGDSGLSSKFQQHASETMLNNTYERGQLLGTSARSNSLISGTVTFKVTYKPYSTEKLEEVQNEPSPLKSYIEAGKLDSLGIGLIEVEVLRARNLMPSDPGTLNEQVRVSP
eukprot:SAG11_NODE_213_length_12262_cov_8.391597_1_plen_232_part_00